MIEDRDLNLLWRDSIIAAVRDIARYNQIYNAIDSPVPDFLLDTWNLAHKKEIDAWTTLWTLIERKKRFDEEDGDA